MSTPITNKDFWAPKPWDDVRVHECGCLCGSVHLDSIGLGSLGQVLGGNHNVDYTIWEMGVDLSNIINPPLLKTNQWCEPKIEHIYVLTFIFH